MLECHKIFIFFNFFDDAVPLGKIFADFPVYQRHQKGPLYFFNTLQGFFIIININQSRYKLLFPIFLNVLMKLCLIKEIERYQELTGLLHFNQAIPVFRGIEIHFSHAYPINPLFPFYLYTVVMFFPVQKFSRYGRENSGYGLVVILVLFCDTGKCFIHPQNLAVVIQQRIGNLKLVQQPFLYGSVLGGKADDLIANHGFVHHVDSKYHQKIYHCKYGHAKTCFPVNKIQRYIHQYN